MPNKGEIVFTILEDGTIKMETGDMAGPAHKAADDLLGSIQRLAGGEVTIESTKHSHTHSHSHAHDHDHDHDHDHSHENHKH